jgi:hypothetical protein
MTIEEADRSALIAAGHGDVIGLRAALQYRARAIASLMRMPPSQELAARLARTIASGKLLDQKLSTLKMRIRTDAARFAAIQASGIEAPSRSLIDCRA